MTKEKCASERKIIENHWVRAAAAFTREGILRNVYVPIDLQLDRAKIYLWSQTTPPSDIMT